ncbi:cytosolic protein [Parageobacillus thermoglucosidasius]|uniref:cytosolic protein n=1 Tax=Parageobacillus thermoglucosidasius TaxID=1426 RepID=UPI000B57BB92|nr:cytosolic protein [Parageobacillus thermoglucosidasius]OUM84002.1 MAG: cytosolic protein [Parageobacillus thermoglucosidasius]
MSVWKKWKYALTNHCETRENHEDEALRSHYYKATNATVIKAVKELFTSSPNYELLSVSEERGEFSATTRQGKKVFIVATVISVRPLEAAVDFSVTTETTFLPFDFGRSRNVIIDLYRQLDQRLPYIGSGINA